MRLLVVLGRKGAGSLVMSTSESQGFLAVRSPMQSSEILAGFAAVPYVC